MTYARGSARFGAGVLDALILGSFALFVARVVWILIPGTEVPAAPMQLYTAAQMRWFFVAVTILATTIVLYHCLLPLTRLQGTIGHRLVGIRLGRPDGSPLTRKEGFRRFQVLIVKCAIVLFLGPVIAAAGGSIGLSWLGLVVPIGMLFCHFLASLQDPEGALKFERMGNYRYFVR